MPVELKIIVGGPDRSRAALGGLALHARDQTQRQILVTEVVMVDTQDAVRERYELWIAKGDRNFLILPRDPERVLVRAATAKHRPNAPKRL